MMKMAEGIGNQGEKGAEAVKFQAVWETWGQIHSKLQTRLTCLIDEEMPTCIWEPLFALLPRETATEWDHLSQESLLSLPR